MEQKFDIETSTPRHPYRVPQGFFAQLEEDILKRTVDAAPAKPCRSYLRPVLNWVATATAAAAIAGGIYFGYRTHTPAEQISVEQAFGELSDADQQYLLDMYSNSQIRELYYAAN